MLESAATINNFISEVSMRPIFLFAISVTVIFLGVFFQKVEGETLKQCMEKCIGHEGGASNVNKTICKSRCGSAIMDKSPVGKRDCMIDFKLCNRTCGKEKIGQPSPCHKQCKVLLRMCT